MRIPTKLREAIPGWKLLAWAAGILLCVNALTAGAFNPAEMNPLPGWLRYQLPSAETLGHWRLWTMLTYALVNPVDWFLGPASIVLLWLVGRTVEAELPRAQFLALCASCALTGAAFWLPLHWSSGEPLMAGSLVLVLGLMAFWCFTVPDEAVVTRVLFVLPLKVRPQALFWIFLALDLAGFLTLELPEVLGHGIKGWRGTDCSPFLGAMFAGWFSAWWLQRQAQAGWTSVPDDEVAPRRWLQKALHAGAWSGQARNTEAHPAREAQPAATAKTNRQQLREELDRILDKINVEGLESLSAEERLTLDQAKEWLAK